MPSPAELLAADPKVLRDSGFSSRKGDTLRALAQRFVDGRLSEEAFAGMTDPEIEAALTESPGSDHGQRAASCWSPSTGPTCSSRATRRFDARSSESTRLTTCRPTRSCSSSQTAGGRTGASRSATCSHPSRTDSIEGHGGSHRHRTLSGRPASRWILSHDDRQPSGACRLPGCSAGTEHRRGATPGPASSGGIILEWRRQTTGILREQLGEERFRWLRSQGEAMDDDQIVTVALDVIDKVRARASLYSDPED